MIKGVAKNSRRVPTPKVIVLPLNNLKILSSGYDYSRLSTGGLLKKLKGVCAAGEGRWVSAYWAPDQVAKAEFDK